MKEHLKHIGANIRAARKNKSLTLDTLSELVGISSSFLGILERGESLLSIETLISICNVLDVSADVILFEQHRPSEPIMSDKKDILFTLLKSATDEELLFLIDYIKLYRGKISFRDNLQDTPLDNA